MIVSVSCEKLECLMSLLSIREMPIETRNAVMLVAKNGYRPTMAEFKSGVTRKRIVLAIRKLERMNRIILDAYVNK